jgi:hypothetical protein
VVTVVGGLILAFILRGTGLDRTGPDVPPIPPPVSGSGAAHPWNEDMTITPSEHTR